MAKAVQRNLKRVASNWYVWLFPVIAIAITGWLFHKYFQERGPEIRILFDDASSIQAEKTRVRYKGVTIGTVRNIALSEDTKSVIAFVRLQKDAEQFAVEGAKFWVVAPKVNFTGISGLETLLAGTYIAALPGKANGDLKEEFKGQLTGDPNDDESMIPYIIQTANAESINPGDAITFRGLNIGSVDKVLLSKTAQMVLIHINIQSKHRRLIRSNSIFWRKVGVQAKLGLFGADVKVNSMESILHGGLEVFTPDPPLEIAKPHTWFTLAPSAPKHYEEWRTVLQ